MAEEKNAMLKKITLSRLSDRQLTLSWQGKAEPDVKVELDNMFNPAQPARACLGHTYEDNMLIEMPTFSKPLLRICDGVYPYTISERVLPLEGANNFRDCGGYVTEDGRQVKWGMLYRSDHLNRLTDKDIGYLQSIGLRSIVDYRNEKEYGKQPNRKIAEDIATYHFIPNASSAELAAKASNDSEKIGQLIELAQAGKGDIAIDNTGRIMQLQFKSFAHDPASLEAYRQLLELVAKPECLPMNQHCRGGKDRTGFGVAIILRLLGVKPELIYQDFMMTGELRKERNERRMAQYQQETDNQQILDFLRSMMETRESYLAAAFDEIDAYYGSFDRYLYDGLGIRPETVEKIKANLLT